MATTIKIELDLNYFLFLFRKDDRRNIKLQITMLKVDIRGNQFDVSFSRIVNPQINTTSLLLGKNEVAWKSICVENY
jgi:hypothetical protein